MARPAKIVFEDRIMPEPNSGCWLWIGHISVLGYGVTWTRDSSRATGWKRQSAHRCAYELFVGPIPEGMELDHLCRVRSCVNPAHLQPVTHTVNVRRGKAAEVNGGRQRAKTHCAWGHEYTPENTRWASSRPHRSCRTCERAKNAHRKLGLKRGRAPKKES